MCVPITTIYLAYISKIPNRTTTSIYQLPSYYINVCLMHTIKQLNGQYGDDAILKLIIIGRTHTQVGMLSFWPGAPSSIYYSRWEKPNTDFVCSETLYRRANERKKREIRFTTITALLITLSMCIPLLVYILADFLCLFFSALEKDAPFWMCVLHSSDDFTFANNA